MQPQVFPTACCECQSTRLRLYGRLSMQIRSLLAVLAAQVTQEVLRYDIEDAWRLQDGTLGCIKGDTTLFQDATKTGAFMFGELAQRWAACAAAASTLLLVGLVGRSIRGSSSDFRPLLNPASTALPGRNAGCGAIPEGWDPRSFRSSFGHNTNIFLFKGPGAQDISLLRWCTAQCGLPGHQSSAPRFPPAATLAAKFTYEAQSSLLLHTGLHPTVPCSAARHGSWWTSQPGTTRL